MGFRPNLSCTIPDGWLYSTAESPRIRPKATCFALRALPLDKPWPLAGTPAGAAGLAGQTKIPCPNLVARWLRAPLRIRSLRSLRTRASAGFLERFYRKIKELWRRGWDSETWRDSRVISVSCQVTDVFVWTSALDKWDGLWVRFPQCPPHWGQGRFARPGGHEAVPASPPPWSGPLGP